MADTLTTPTTNLVLIAALVHKDGRNISTIEIADTFASKA